MELVISIGTTHPWNIAGVGLDLHVGDELGVRVVTAVMAVSAQDEDGIRALEPLAAPVIRAQLESMPWAQAGAIRVGALGSAHAVTAVAKAIREAAPAVPAVIDPVFGATRGGRFADEATVAAIRDELATLPNAILTPNLAEAAQLLGADGIALEKMVEAATALQRRGPQAVLLKGGHLEGAPMDVLAGKFGAMTFSETRLPADMRGTGCTLAMALACHLAFGETVIEAVQNARRFVRTKIAAAKTFHGLRVAY